MPKVVQYGSPQVSTNVARGARAQSVNLGGQAIASGIQSLGAGIAEAQQRADLIAAEDASLGFERAKNDLLFNADNGYFTTQGKNAYNGVKDANEAIDSLIQTHGTGLSPDALRAFSKVADSHKTQANVRIQTHAAQGLADWQYSTNQSVVENSIEASALYWNDDKEFKLQMATGEEAVIDNASTKGLDSQEAAESYRSTYISSAIQAALDGETSTTRALELMDQYGKHLEPQDKKKMGESIDARQVAVAEETNAGLVSAVADNAVNNYETWGEINEAINDKITDKALRKDALSAASSLWNNKQAILNESSVTAELEVNNMLAGGLPMSMIRAEYPNFWSEGQLNGAAKLRLKLNEAGRVNAKLNSEAVANNKAMGESQKHNAFLLSAMSKEEIDSLDVMELVDGNVITPAQGSTALKRQKSIREGNEDQSLLSVSQSVKQFMDLNFKSDDDEGKAQFYSVIQPAIDRAQQAKGADLTPQEVRDVMQPDLNNWVIKQGIFFDSTMDGVTDPTTRIAFNQALTRIGKNRQVAIDLASLLGRMTDEGEPVTQFTLMARYNQALTKE